MAGTEGGHSTRAVLAALAANAGIAVAKFAAFLVTRSASMLAESVHSLADTGNQGLLLLGGRRSKRPATPQHPFGYGRERYFWSFVVALMLFSLGGMFAIYEGIEKIIHPHELESPLVAIGVLVIAIVLEGLSFRTAIRESRHVKEPGITWWGFIRRAKQPELPVVLLEDLGALTGLVIAFCAVGVAIVTDDARYDGIGTLSIGLLLVAIAAVLAVEMKGLLIGEAASEIDQQAIAAAIEVDPGVQRLIHLRTEHIGPDELLVGAKIELIDGLDLHEVVEIVDSVETAVRRAVPSARVMYLEPDIFRTSTPDHEALSPTERAITPKPAAEAPAEAEVPAGEPAEAEAAEPAEAAEAAAE
jgi:cation diffusion facilitator family transporter